MEATNQNRPYVSGKFLMIGNEKFFIKGVTYGTFKPKSADSLIPSFPETEIVERDFKLMSLNGINSIRTYILPTQEILDLAYKYNVKVMAGLWWEQHITFLDRKATIEKIINTIKANVLQLKNHPSILCYNIGNEITSSIARWYGKEKIEDFLKRLFNVVKEIDKQTLVTYVNFPTTEYLHLPFLDFYCFNVYLETKEKLEAYISRLHNICGHKPMVLGEIGLDSTRNGEELQAETLKWQLELNFSKGVAGTFVFSWTDEWWCGGRDMDDWTFGIVNKERLPKPALSEVEELYKHLPYKITDEFPFFSVVVCSYNGSKTIQETLEGLKRLDYPKFEVIIIDDGSTDNLSQIAALYPFKLIRTENKGLSCARNTGIDAACGEIVAFIDDDAYPDKHWLHYLAYTFRNSDFVGVGGLNIQPKNDHLIAQCVANSPGGPIHVLLTDEVAEHIPGCNMAIKKIALDAIGGFDATFRTAGDDVDLCWRLQSVGYKIGFHPSAFVWHHRRNSIRAYWKQQKGYGKAEALLEKKWREKYNRLGHLKWAGSIYGSGLFYPLLAKRKKIFHGVWGSAYFQSVYKPIPSSIFFLPMMPEWYLLIAFLSLLSSLCLLWHPLILFVPPLILIVTLTFVQAIYNSLKIEAVPETITSKFSFYGIVSFLNILQPIARLIGRIQYGLTPIRVFRTSKEYLKMLFVFKKEQAIWSQEKWISTNDALKYIEDTLLKQKVRVSRGSNFSKWDLFVSCGFFASTKSVYAVEEHGMQKQMIRFRTRVNVHKTTGILIITFAMLAMASAFNHAYNVSIIFGLLAFAILFQTIIDAARSMFIISSTFELLSKR